MNAGDLARFRAGNQSHVSPKWSLCLDTFPGIQPALLLDPNTYYTIVSGIGAHVKENKDLQSRSEVLTMKTSDHLAPVPTSHRPSEGL
jgi:hypothetical protein